MIISLENPFFCLLLSGRLRQVDCITVKFLNFWTPENFAVIYLKYKKNYSEDPDQTAALGAVWSGYALFAETDLSENLG